MKKWLPIAIIILFALFLTRSSVSAAMTVSLDAPTQQQDITGSTVFRASTSSLAQSLQFFIIQRSSRATYSYAGVSAGSEWILSWNSTLVADDGYQVYAAAVDAQGNTYLSQFVEIRVGNEAQYQPDPDTNLNTNQPPPSANTNDSPVPDEVPVANTNSDTNTNSTTNENTNSGPALVQTPPLDTDGDGIPDIQEIKTDPQNPDTDTDGLTDGYEVNHKLDPTRANQDFPSIANIPSVYLGVSTGVDADHDQLDDGIEKIIGTSPTSPDTDGDGLTDGFEFRSNRNPSVAEPDDTMKQYNSLATVAASEFPWLSVLIFVLIVVLFGGLGYALSRQQQK